LEFHTKANGWETVNGVRRFGWALGWVRVKMTSFKTI